MSTTAKRLWLKLLGRVGVRSFRATSGLGYPFICHVGDFVGEAPFYVPNYSETEIKLMAAWCRAFEKPIIYDVGANLGFVATQLAQALNRNATIICFEPVPSTFQKLTDDVTRLGLEEAIITLNCAVSDRSGILKIAYNPKESLFAQVRNDTANARAGQRLAYCSCITLDTAVESLGLRPHLVKIDVEGFEDNVVKGAKGLLGGDAPPALLFEWNPVTMREVGSLPAALAERLNGYWLRYVDDFEGQRRPFGEEVSDVSAISWVCNLFALPSRVAADANWERCSAELRGAMRPEQRNQENTSELAASGLP